MAIWGTGQEEEPGGVEGVKACQGWVKKTLGNVSGLKLRKCRLWAWRFSDQVSEGSLEFANLISMCFAPLQRFMTMFPEVFREGAITSQSLYVHLAQDLCLHSWHYIKQVQRGLWTPTGTCLVVSPVCNIHGYGAASAREGWRLSSLVTLGWHLRYLG